MRWQNAKSLWCKWGKTMKSYVDVISFLNTQISELNFEQAVTFVQRLIKDFVKKLPSDWLDNELLDEKPFYRTLAQLLTEPHWELSQLTAQIAGLDTIMDAMGEDYPHNTDAYALAVLTMVDYYLQIFDNSEQFQGFVMGVVDEYMNMADFEAQDADSDNWLEAPPIAQAVTTITNLLEQVKKI